MSNIEKTRQLGMNFSTASDRMRKILMFHLAKKCGMDTCFQCGKPITSVEDLSIEHMTPWMHSEDPVALFFDPDNLAFSHKSCNYGAARKSIQDAERIGDYKRSQRKVGPRGTAWCSQCQKFLPRDMFASHAGRWNGVNSKCKKCFNESRKNRHAPLV